MTIFKKLIFTAISILFLSLSFFIGTTEAANPPAGCSCPGPGGTCVGGASYWISPTQYQGYYYCNFGGWPCPGPIACWTQTSTSNESMDSHGCDSPTCTSGGCAVGGILWTQDVVTPPSCTLSTDSTSILKGETVILSWTVTDTATADISGIGSLTPAEIAAGSGVITTPPLTSDVTYTMTVNGTCAGPVTCPPVTIQVFNPPTGGIVPCGRMVDNLSTPYNETQPCTLCHIFIMLQMIVTFVVEIGGIIAVFFLVIGGLIYSTSAGDQGRMETGKKAMMWALFGLAIILLSWLIVTIVLTAFGYVNPLGGQWNIVNCSV